MKKFFTGAIIAILSIIFISPVSAIDPFQFEFYGTWCYEETEIYYTISEYRIVVTMPSDGTGFTVQINEWELVYNDEFDTENYPSGFSITGTIETMTGSWWIEPGDSYTWTWYISNDRKSLLYGENSIFVKQ